MEKYEEQGRYSKLLRKPASVINIAQTTNKKAKAKSICKFTKVHSKRNYAMSTTREAFKNK